MAKAVIFDLNGVFLKADYLSDRIEKEYGISGNNFWLALKKVLEKTRKPDAPSFFKLLEPYFKDFNFSISEEEFFNFWFSGEKLVSEVLEYSKSLRYRGIKVFILSNNFKERTEHYRKNFKEIFDSVDRAYFSWETGFIKPDKQAYENILNEHNFKAEECIYFDDSEENIKSAKSLGINAFKYEGLDSVKKIIEQIFNK